MCEHTCTYTYTHAHIHTYKRKTCHLSSVYRLENYFWPPLHLSPMISMFMALLIIPSNIYTSQFSHDDHLHFGGEEIWEVPQKGHTWGYFALEPGSGVGLVGFASSSLPVLSHCWFRRGAISPSRLFSDVRKQTHVFIFADNSPNLLLLANLRNGNSGHMKEEGLFFSLI